MKIIAKGVQRIRRKKRELVQLVKFFSLILSNEGENDTHINLKWKFEHFIHLNKTINKRIDQSQQKGEKKLSIMDSQ